MKIGSVLIEGYFERENEDRLYILEEILKEYKGLDLLLLPAGFLNSEDKEARTIYKEIEKTCVSMINSYSNKNLIICLGIDGSYDEDSGCNLDQVGLAISKNGIISIGRKFYPTQYESEYIKTSDSPYSKEDNKERIFEHSGKKFYLAVCYDSFGIKHQDVKNIENVDVILNLIHGFHPDASGATDFARKGCAGASKQWNVPIFLSAIFENLNIANFPAGIQVEKGTSLIYWTYNDNLLNPSEEIEYIPIEFEYEEENEIEIEEENIYVFNYNL